METLNVIITEIVICLIVAWILGFLTSWFFFRKVAKAYSQEREELLENIQYSNLCNKNQEREIIKQSHKIEELKKELDLKHPHKKEIVVELKESNKEDIEILHSIENNLDAIK